MIGYLKPICCAVLRSSGSNTCRRAACLSSPGVKSMDLTSAELAESWSPVRLQLGEQGMLLCSGCTTWATGYLLCCPRPGMAWVACIGQTPQATTEAALGESAVMQHWQQGSLSLKGLPTLHSTHQQPYLLQLQQETPLQRVPTPGSASGGHRPRQWQQSECWLPA